MNDNVYPTDFFTPVVNDKMAFVVDMDALVEYAYQHPEQYRVKEVPKGTVEYNQIGVDDADDVFWKYVKVKDTEYRIISNNKAVHETRVLDISKGLQVIYATLYMKTDGSEKGVSFLFHSDTESIKECVDILTGYLIYC